jgi:hypothetical protein
MAQTGFTPISNYYSTTASAVPTAANLVPGELAINTNDGKLYYEDSSGVVQVLATKSTGSIGGSNTQVQFNNSGSLGGSSGLTWDGSFLTTSSIKNSALTSGRVTYAGASGLLSDSANLTYNGTGLGIGGVSATAKLDILNSNATYSLSQKVFNASAGTFFLGQSPSATFLSVDNFAMAFCTNSDGGVAGTSVPTNERMRILSTGAVTIGDTASYARFAVRGFTGTSGSYNLVAHFGDGVSGNSGYIVQGGASSNTIGLLADSGSLILGTGLTEKARIDSSGNLLVGTTGLGTIGSSSGSTITASGAIYSASTGESIFSRRSSDGDVILFRRDTSSVGSIAVTTLLTTYNTTSDYRLKTVTGSVMGQGERIDALKPIDYQWKKGNEQARGFLAHEFQTVYPNSVTGEKDAIDADGKPVYQTMQASTAEVIADLVAEIQSLRQRIATLENK